MPLNNRYLLLSSKPRDADKFTGEQRMSTSPSSLSSSSSSSSSAQTIAALLAPQTFVGVSQYSSDLQSILTRAVQIAQLPVQALQQQQADMVSKISALGNLQTDVNAMATSLTSLSTVAANKGVTASSSDTNTVTATVSGNPPATTYTITNLTSIAAPASETSVNNFSDATKTQVSPSGTMTLTLGSQTATITLSAATNNLQGLANAINSAKDAKGNAIPVTATMITSSNNQDYLSVTANDPGQTTLTLTEGGPAGTDFLTQRNQGADTKFTLNGNISVDSQSTMINNVIPGLTLNILQADPGGTVTVSLNSNASPLANALSDFVSKYNTLLGDVNAQAGQSGGALNGDSAISTLRDDMRQLTNYTGSGVVRSLYDLGISMDNSGTMTFDPTALNSMSNAQLQAAFAYIGSTTTGLASLGNVFAQLGDPVSGVIQNEVAGYNTTENNINNQVTLKAVQVNQMQANLQRQLAAADSMIAELESQQNMLSSTVQAMNYASYGYQQNPNG